MPSSDPAQRFADILDNILRIERFTTGLNFHTFSANEETLYAVKHALLIISEAAAKLGELAAELCPGVDWRDVRGLGNRLRHEYDNIDLIRLWRIGERDLPILKAAVAPSLEALRRKENSGPD